MEHYSKKSNLAWRRDAAITVMYTLFIVLIIYFVFYILFHSPAR